MWRKWHYNHYSLAVKGIVDLVVPIQVQHTRIHILGKLNLRLFEVLYSTLILKIKTIHSVFERNRSAL